MIPNQVTTTALFFRFIHQWGGFLVYKVQIQIHYMFRNITTPFFSEVTMQGFIKLHRSILEWEWYKDIPVRILFEHCLLRANHKENYWHGKLIKAGSFITSLDNLAFETGLTKMQVRTAIKKLISTCEITHKGYSKYSVITIINWFQYQENNTQDNTQITHNQHTNNTQITPNKNDKNDKNIIMGNKKINNFSVPLVEDIKAYCEERQNKVDAERFYDYYESKGWMIGKNKMKDWKAAIRTWERKADLTVINSNKEGSYNCGF